MSVPETWFSETILDGLQRLAVMKLASTPQDQELALAGAIWVDALWQRRAWQEDPDAGRLRQAFTALASSTHRWPAPADLLDHLPARPQRAALPGPDRAPIGKAHLAVMKTLIARALKPMPGTTPRSST